MVRRGLITLPKELREQNRIDEGDTLTLIDLGEGVFVMSPRRSRVDEIANKLASEWRESGETLESMLKTLREVRAEYELEKALRFFWIPVCCLPRCFRPRVERANYFYWGSGIIGIDGRSQRPA